MAESLNVAGELVESSGVSAEPRPDARGRRMAVSYLLGPRVIVSFDPDLADTIAEVVATMNHDATTLESWRRAAAEAGGRALGEGRQQVLSPTRVPPLEPKPDGFELRLLSADSAADRDLIADLLDVTSADDAAEAEVTLDDLDPHIAALIDSDGRIASYWAARPFDRAPEFGDIGILTREDCRGLNLGSYLVASMCSHMRSRGLEPLYRCDEVNEGSVRLSAGLGFQIASRLSGFGFGDP